MEQVSVQNKGLVQFDEIVILQIRDGKVLRQRGVVDNLSALRQLGAVPSPR
jgi:predicted ester cyclase